MPSVSAPASPSVPAAPTGPAIGGTLTAPPGPGGFATPGPPTAIVGPLARSQIGGIGFPFNSVGAVTAPGGPGVRVPGWTITPSIGVQQAYNDNIFYTARNRTDDFITSVIPGLLLNVDTLRLQGTLNYAPSIDFYWQNSSQNRVSQIGNGQFLATVVPDLFFIDLRGAASVQSLSGGFTPGTEPSVAKADQVQSLSFSVSPYLVHRFGGLATARLGYTYSYVNQEQADQKGQVLVGQQRVGFTPSEYSSNQGYLVVRTGEDFGRLAMQGSISGTSYIGNGIYDGAYRNFVNLETRYAITRTIAGLVEIGYEDIYFNTTPRTEISGITWAFGTRLTPNPDSVIIAKYGRRDGFNSFFLDGTWAIGVRTNLAANYNDRLSSSGLDAGGLLSNVTLDPLGNPVDATTGIPVIPAYANSFLGVQGGLYRQKQGSVTLSQTWLRDTFSLTATRTDRTPIADSPGSGQIGVAQKATSFVFSWGHDLAEGTRLTSFASYGYSTQATADDTNYFGLGAILVHQINPGLVGNVTYRLNAREGGFSSTGQPQGNDRAVQNIISVGLRQSF